MGHSTETARLSIKNEVHLSLSRGKPTALILLDLWAAFDTIDHSTLLHCLRTWFGVGGSVLKWFTSYLSERHQSIKIGCTLSDLCKLLFGVPQGSVLGPLLFSQYTTPLSLVIGKHKGVKFHCYADDFQVYIHLSQFLTHDVSVLVANALFSSQLDYCNSLFRSLSKFNLRKLQCIQNSAARIISSTSRYTSIIPVLKKLHWLHVEHHTVFKTATLVY